MKIGEPIMITNTEIFTWKTPKSPLMESLNNLEYLPHIYVNRLFVVTAVVPNELRFIINENIL